MATNSRPITRSMVDAAGALHGRLEQWRVSDEALPISYTFLQGSGRGCPLLRASSDHCFTVGALRARWAPGRSLPHPSKLACFTSLGMHP